MTDEQVKQVIDAILNGTLLDNWHFYIISFFVSLITISGFAFLKSYFTEQGKYAALETKLDLIEKKAEAAENAKFTAILNNLDAVKDQVLTQEKAKYQAIEESLETIEKQVKATTLTSENIKTSLDHGNWRKKELEILKREKLELYYTHIYNIYSILHGQMIEILENEDHTREFEDFNDSCIIQSLYLPEFEIEQLELANIVNGFSSWVNNEKSLVEKGKAQGIEHNVSNDSKTTYENLTKLITAQRNKIMIKIQDIAKELNN